MLDTNTLIYLMRNHPVSVTERANELTDDDMLCMSFFTFAELLNGAEGSNRKADTLIKLNALTLEVPVVYSVSRSLCQHYAEQYARLKTQGTPIGANDLWIACHALAEQAVLVTNNRREFDRVQGLQVENWVG